MIGVEEHGGHTHVLGIDSGSRMVVRAMDGGGSVAVFGDNSTEIQEEISRLAGVNNEDDMKSYAALSVNKEGGFVTVAGGGKKDRGVLMSVDKYDGYVMVNGANGSRVLD